LVLAWSAAQPVLKRLAIVILSGSTAARMWSAHSIWERFLSVNRPICETLARHDAMPVAIGFEINQVSRLKQ